MASADQMTSSSCCGIDARRVQIKSKGLGIRWCSCPSSASTAAHRTRPHCTVVGGQRQLLEAGQGRGLGSGHRAARTRQRAEDARLYVGLTRAEHALWIAVGDLAGLGKTRLAPLLGDLQALRALADVHIDDSERRPRCRSWRRSGR